MRNLYDCLVAYFGTEKNADLFLKKHIDKFEVPLLKNLKGKFRDLYPASFESDEIVHKNSQTNGRNYNLTATILVTCFDIPLETFDLQESAIGKFLAQKVLSGSIEILPLKNFDGTHKIDLDEKSQQYKTILLNFLSHWHSDLFVYDYFYRQFDAEFIYLNAYVFAHSDLYDIIEKRLKTVDHSLVYSRVLALPVTYGFNNFQQFTPERLKLESIKELSIPLFRHLCTCLVIFKSFPTDQESKSGFYAVSSPTRLYSFGLINNGEYLMTEHYKYNKSGHIKPDILFVEEGKGSLSVLKESYVDEKNKLTSEKRDKIAITDIKKSLESLEKLSNAEREKYGIQEKIDLALKIF